ETIDGGDVVELGKTPLGLAAIEDVSANGRDCRPDFPPERSKLAVLVHGLGEHDFARVEPRDLSSKAGRIAFRQSEFAGGNIGKGKAETRLGVGDAQTRDRQQKIATRR